MFFLVGRSVKGALLLPLALCCAITVVQAATLYECRSYGGATFFSSEPCFQQRAAGVAVHTVPDGLTQEQQIKLLDDARTRKASEAKAEDERRQRLGQCAQIDDELRQLEKKYTSWQYVPIDEVNVDQRRERDLKSRRSQLQCH